MQAELGNIMGGIGIPVQHATNYYLFKTNKGDINEFRIP